MGCTVQYSTVGAGVATMLLFRQKSKEKNQITAWFRVPRIAPLVDDGNCQRGGKLQSISSGCNIIIIVAH